MISVDEALTRVLEPLRRLPSETIAFADGNRRVLAAPVVAARTQPPCDVSAMDGYAVRAEDVGATPAELEVVGTSQAGHAYPGSVGRGEAVRIFTGAALPAGADTIVLQEGTDARNGTVRVLEAAGPGRHVRRKGIDFDDGRTLLDAGHRLGPRDLALLAAANVTRIVVTRKPKVAILPTGDELVEPGESPAPDGIVSSTPYALAAYIEDWGGEAALLPIARDDPASLDAALACVGDADVLVTLGGASVGERDIVQSALARHGLQVDFWKVAIKPGKPLIYGRLGRRVFFGLPGNPVSSLVCALVFLRPTLGALSGRKPEELGAPLLAARLAGPLPANGSRHDYLRGSLCRENATLVATPFRLQDSSVQSLFAAAGCLIVRSPHAPASAAGDAVLVWPLAFCE